MDNGYLLRWLNSCIFVDTPSIFESLILKQFDLYFKIIITHVLPIDLTLLCFYFWVDRINIM